VAKKLGIGMELLIVDFLIADCDWRPNPIEAPWKLFNQQSAIV
jgi:hypothetical protein